MASDESRSIEETPREDAPSASNPYHGYVEALAGTDDAQATAHRFRVRRACATLLLVAGAALLQRSSAGSDVVMAVGGWGLVLLSAGVFVHARTKGLRQLTARYAAAGLPRAVAQRYAARTLVGALPD